MGMLGRAYPVIIHEARYGADWRAADDWRRLHHRPDAEPLPDEEPRAGLLARVRSAMPVRQREVDARR